LREHGLKNPIAQITRVAQIDLDGAGEDDVVISATHYKDGDKIRDESTTNTYSFVMLARFQQGTTKTELVASEFLSRSEKRCCAKQIRDCGSGCSEGRRQDRHRGCARHTAEATKSAFTNIRHLNFRRH
jgi:hypothetical protein